MYFRFAAGIFFEFVATARGRIVLLVSSISVGYSTQKMLLIVAKSIMWYHSFINSQILMVPHRLIYNHRNS